MAIQPRVAKGIDLPGQYGGLQTVRFASPAGFRHGRPAWKGPAVRFGQHDLLLGLGAGAAQRRFGHDNRLLGLFARGPSSASPWFSAMRACTSRVGERGLHIRLGLGGV